MDIKFNSLFDNELNPDDSKHYSIDRQDTTLLLSTLIFQSDLEKEKAIETLEKRNFGDHYNYILSGRPCSAGLCSSGKFCESSGWPESSGLKRKNVCDMPLSPNSSIGDPMIWADNIDIEAKLKKIDIIDSKCHLKQHKEDPCANNPQRCALKCHKDKIAGDYMLHGMKNIDTHPQAPPRLSDGVQRVKKAQAEFCKKLPQRFNEASRMITNIPTKRRDVLNW